SCRLSPLPRLDDRCHKTMETRGGHAAQTSVHMLSPGDPKTSALSRTWTANRLGMAGSLLAPTTKDIFRRDRSASGQTVADWRLSGLASPHSLLAGGALGGLRLL